MKQLWEDKPATVCEKAGFVVKDYDGFSIPHRYFLLAINHRHNEWAVAPLEDEEKSLDKGIFENFNEEMLRYDYTIKQSREDSRGAFVAAAETGRQWSARHFVNHDNMWLTFSFDTESGLVDFKLRLPY